MKSLIDVQNRIREACLRVNRAPESVRLVAVSKTFPVSKIQEVAAAGQQLFGENYAQECAEKVEELSDSEIEFHFVGTLQSNKARLVVGRVSLIHSVDRSSLASEINRLSVQRGMKQPILIQVNTSGERTKGGVLPADLGAFYRDLKSSPGIDIQGLMCIHNMDASPDQARLEFRMLRELRDSLDPSLPELSMGMSGDFEEAIEEGATLIRVGTKIFGNRTRK